MNTEITKAKTMGLTRIEPTLAMIVESFINSQDVNPSSKALYNRTLKQYFNWIQREKQALTPELGKKLLTYFEHKAKRDYAIVNLLIRIGLRTIEASRANVEDITFKSGKRVLMVHGKGRDSKDNFVIQTDKTYQPIEAYLKTRRNVKGGKTLFISTFNNSLGERLSISTISRVVKDGMRDIGLDGKEFTAHSLRHTTAVNILRAGGRIEDAQGVFRHTSPSTTQIYTETIKEEMRLNNPAEELIDNLM